MMICSLPRLIDLDSNTAEDTKAVNEVRFLALPVRPLNYGYRP